MYKITIGSDEYRADRISSGSALLFSRHAMVGEELTTDELRFTLDGNSVSVPANIEDRYDVDTAVIVETDSGIIGRFYYQSIARCGAARYQIYAVSAVGVLLKSRHMGGIYNGVTAATLLADILTGFTYTVSPEVASATVTGYLPIATRRDNLQQVLLAIGATVTIDNLGTVSISPMTSVSAGDFTAARCFIGGSVTKENAVDGVKLTEHNYFPSGETATLFSDGINGTETIEFSEPHHSLVCTGATIVSSGANFCVISGTGTVTLTGQKYTHVTRIVTAGNVTPGATANIKSVTTAYLANPQIAQTLVDRIYAMLQCRSTIETEVILGAERAGDVCRVRHPYTGTLTSACIKELNATLSSVNRARGKFLVGFVPSGVISGYQHHTLLTGSGSWTVPEGVTKLRAIIVGGGGGGGGSHSGRSGGSTQVTAVVTRTVGNSTDHYNTVSGSPYGEGGSGGRGGDAGVGGSIFEITLDVTPGQVFSYACGAGGAGGAAEGGDGTAGAVTLFGLYSSAYGKRYPYGYYEPKTQLTFGANGAEGEDGGAGGRGSEEGGYDSANPTPYTGVSGGAVGASAGGFGAIGYEYSYKDSWDYRHRYIVGGGGGGGAAKGAPCGNYPANYPPRGSGSAYRTTYLAIRHGGNGSNGTAGDDAAATAYGAGGGGGNGGGGGGGAEVYYLGYREARDFYDIYYAGTGGTGGSGAAGGAGASGCCVIYY